MLGLFYRERIISRVQTGPAHNLTKYNVVVPAGIFGRLAARKLTGGEVSVPVEAPAREDNDFYISRELVRVAPGTRLIITRRPA